MYTHTLHLHVYSVLYKMVMETLIDFIENQIGKSFTDLAFLVMCLQKYLGRIIYLLAANTHVCIKIPTNTSVIHT